MRQRELKSTLQKRPALDQRQQAEGATKPANTLAWVRRQAAAPYRYALVRADGAGRARMQRGLVAEGYELQLLGPREGP